MKLIRNCSSAENVQIENVAADLGCEGYTRQIVYRNSIDVALAEVTLALTPLTDKFNAMVWPSHNAMVIGVRNADDDKKIRTKVETLRKAAGL